ncbi:3D domain-containing protein [Fundicoccus culcitae]|uniref:3D domain-containing protein n=1 Tax=Fundicoccus culcitae TaxID=2969821 RepID=A0ABY5P9P8_9LACT|nr:3D domain-containing protein [Fundicoccus culcitae]UUX35326.1 3D domain-containing protein [Fundicoccus culcitae]
MRKSLKIAVAAMTLSVATLNMPFASAANWTRRSDDEVAASVNNAIQSNDSLYIIQWGDTLSSISRATGLDVAELANVNQIANPDLILAGAVLFFDNTNHTVTYVDQTGAQDTYSVEEAVEVAWEEPVVEEVVTEEVVVEEVPVAEEVVTEDPAFVVEDTTEWVPETEVPVEEVVVEEPVAEESIVWEDPAVEEVPVEEEPTWEEPVVEEELPVVEEPAEEVDVPAEEVDVPVVEEPAEEIDVPAEEVEVPVVEEPVVEEPVVEEPVVEEPVVETPADDPTSYGRAITVEATAYSRNQPELSNFTANGTDLRVNGAVIAVDPSVIPLGSTVYVPGYGYLTAADTGGAIQGNRIDIHMENLSAAYAFGRQTITIYVVD